MESPRSAEELRKIDQNLEELTKKVQSRVQLIRDDLNSLIGEIEKLRTHIDERRHISNDYSREISDLTNEYQAMLDQLTGIGRESEAQESNLDSVNNSLLEIQNKLAMDKNQLSNLESERSSLSAILKNDEQECGILKQEYDEKVKTFDSKFVLLEKQYSQLRNEKDMLAFKYKAIRILSQSYLQTPEVNLLRFLANKPSRNSTLNEVRSSLGIDPSSLNAILEKLALRKVLDLDSAAGTIILKFDIDLFNKEA
jgi:chromosome segregation ATPase